VKTRSRCLIFQEVAFGEEKYNMRVASVKANAVFVRAICPCPMKSKPSNENRKIKFGFLHAKGFHFPPCHSLARNPFYAELFISSVSQLTLFLRIRFSED